MGKKPHLPPITCAICGKSFKPTRTWQRFCGPACRDQARADKLTAEYACEYCGLVADAVDHVPPRAVRPTLIELGLAARIPFLEVRSCHECNCGLGDRPLWTIPLRKRHLRQWLRRRYRKYLAIPAWSDADLANLSREMAEYVLHGLAVKQLTLARLKRLSE